MKNSVVANVKEKPIVDRKEALKEWRSKKSCTPVKRKSKQLEMSENVANRVKRDLSESNSNPLNDLPLKTCKHESEESHLRQQLPANHAVSLVGVKSPKLSNHASLEVNKENNVDSLVLQTMANIISTFNKGTLKEIMRVKMVGKKRAEAIVCARDQESFKDLDDLSRAHLKKSTITSILKANLPI